MSSFILSCWRQSNHPVSLEVFNLMSITCDLLIVLRTFFSGSSPVGGFHRQVQLLIECCGHSRKWCTRRASDDSPSEADDAMKSAVYVPFQIFFDPAATFILQCCKWHYVAAPIDIVFQNSLPRFIFSSDLLIADPKRHRRLGRCLSVAPTNWYYDKPCTSFLITTFFLGFQFTIPSPCLWRVLAGISVRREEN